MKVLNVTKNYYVKYTQALRGIEECSFEWVEPGKTVRSLTLAESVAKRNEQAANREPLPYAEIPGVKFTLPQDANLIRQAHEFAASQA